MPPTATVIVPTHERPELAELAVQGVLQQTLPDLEVVVIGDGVPDGLRTAYRRLEDLDARVRFLDLPKAGRTGEPHRHRVLNESRARIAAYCSDDDVWLPDHLETLLGAFDAGVDFAHTLAAWIHPDGVRVEPGIVDLADARWRDVFLSGENRVSLSNGAHTIEAYRRLRRGWSDTPHPLPTDLYMWQSFLMEPWCSATTLPVPTVLQFPSPLRPNMTATDRLSEVKAWTSHCSSPDGYAHLLEMMLNDAQGIRLSARLELDVRALQSRVEALDAATARRAAEITGLRDILDRQALVLDACQAELHTVYGSRGWWWLERARTLRNRVRRT